jgi:hypothetical protein
MYKLKELKPSNQTKLINGLVFQLVTLDKSYRKKWNVSNNSNDFGIIMRNGEIVNDKIFRIGGLSTFNQEDEYMSLLYQKESFYSKEIMDMSKSGGTPNHLANLTSFLNKNGETAIIFEDKFNYPRIVGGCIYAFDNNYYNIKTNEFICSGYDAMKSKDFLFVNSRYNKDKNKRGVFQINIHNGTYVTYPMK